MNLKELSINIMYRTFAFFHLYLYESALARVKGVVELESIFSLSEILCAITGTDSRDFYDVFLMYFVCAPLSLAMMALVGPKVA